MRRVSFVLMILAVAWTNSAVPSSLRFVRRLRTHARDAVLDERAPDRDARQEPRDTRQDARDTRQEARRHVATIDKRGARHVGMSDKRRGRSGRRPRAVTPCGLRRFATGILEIGSRSERTGARVARQVATIDKRGARHVGMSDRGAAIGETTTSCYALRICGASRPGFWRSAVGQRGPARGSPGKSRRSTRGARGTSG